MKEYTVKITEIRYEYVCAENRSDAIAKAEDMVITNADDVDIEIVDEKEID